MRYDAAIIGAGADGLAAAAVLARAGLRTILLERGRQAGGHCLTSEFHPGFRASLFADELAPIPPEIFRGLNLAHHGAVFTDTPALSPLARRAAALREAALVRALADADSHPGLLSVFHPSTPWPGQDWSLRALDDLITDEAARSDARQATLGRALDPQLAGTALHLLAPKSGSGMARGGLGALGRALAASAVEAGAELRLETEIHEVRRTSPRTLTLGLADGSDIAAAAILSTLDLRHSFLSLFKWAELPGELIARIGKFRLAGSTARLLVALEKPPPGLAAAPHFLDPAPAAAFAAWQERTMPHQPPLALRLVTASDPSLAPPGAAVVTVTLGCIPHRLFDGPWTRQKRSQLQSQAFVAIRPLLGEARPLAVRLLPPPDIEEALDLTDGDLDGGEIAADQMFGLRPGARTSVRGFYLAGPSSMAGPLGTCAAGLVAARALLADSR